MGKEEEGKAQQAAAHGAAAPQCVWGPQRGLLSGWTRLLATLYSPKTRRSPAATVRLSCQSLATRCLATAAGQRVCHRCQLWLPASPTSLRAVCCAALHIALCQQPGVDAPRATSSPTHAAPSTAQHSKAQRAACLVVAVTVDQVGGVDHHAQAALILDEEGFAAVVAGSRADARIKTSCAIASSLSAALGQRASPVPMRRAAGSEVPSCPPAVHRPCSPQ